jgi:hypothetical protein
MEYFLSGHGGQNTGKMYTLKTRLVTFCPFGQGLDVALSWPLFDALCKGSDISGVPGVTATTHNVGESVAEMTLYPTTDFSSGIYKVGGGKIPLNCLSSGQFTLKDFCLMHRHASVVYWIACLS